MKSNINIKALDLSQIAKERQLLNMELEKMAVRDKISFQNYNTTGEYLLTGISTVDKLLKKVYS